MKSYHKQAELVMRAALGVTSGIALPAVPLRKPSRGRMLVLRMLRWPAARLRHAGACTRN